MKWHVVLGWTILVPSILATLALVALVEVAGTQWHVGVIHSTPPQLGAGAWAADAGEVNAMAMEFQLERLLLVGDFNAIDQHHPMVVLNKNPNIRNAMDGDGREGLEEWQPTGTEHKGIIAQAYLPDR